MLRKMGKKCRESYDTRKQVPKIGGYFLVLGQLRIQNLYEGATASSPCGTQPLSIIKECFVIEAQQKGRFVTLQILNQPICPILCALVHEFVGGEFVGWKMIGSGGNTSSNYNFDITKMRGGCATKLSYYFTDGFNKPGAPFTNGIATTGFGEAKRINKEQVPALVARFPGGSCGTSSV